jgi:hypothetical protein
MSLSFLERKEVTTNTFQLFNHSKVFSLTIPGKERIISQGDRIRLQDFYKTFRPSNPSTKKGVWKKASWSATKTEELPEDSLYLHVHDPRSVLQDIERIEEAIKYRVKYSVTSCEYKVCHSLSFLT